LEIAQNAIAQLREVYDFFMLKLAAVIKQMRELRENNLPDESELLSIIRKKNAEIRRRLEPHNKLEESEVYLWENNLVTSAGIRGIGTRGGWTQLEFTPDAFKDRLTVYGSIGIDDPRNEDLVSFFPSYFRSRNLAYAFNAIYKITSQFQIGAEFRRVETQYFVIGERTNNHVNLGAAYSF
jgi:hypothetical protein